MSTMTAEETKIHTVLVGYDKVRKGEGYSVAYRRWAHYANVHDGKNGKRFGHHVETLYIHPDGKSLLTKTMPDGDVVAFEAVK